ncbi:MAG: OmpA family protein [Epsilonproteobacteria bacterium]|nr:OmpA family protein [Campylobacterota bacterium]
MKKLLLIPALFATLASANEYKYEISPEFSILYSPKAKYDGTNPKDTAITRGMFNGVYTFESSNTLTPFVKAGVGIEGVNNETARNDDGFFLDAGTGVKYTLSEAVALKAEAIYMAKLTGIQNKRVDNNLIAMVGLTFAFGEAAQPKAESKPKPKPVAKPKLKSKPVATVAVVTLDDDKDGVKNSLDQCPTTAEGVMVDANGCALDSDKDGVIDNNDKCPNTELGAEVDPTGCDIDTDKDGVLNANDICPNTPAGAEVNNDGCPKTVKLAINFENNSAAIKPGSNEELDQYASFLKNYTNYSAKIIDYTDSRGSAAYNQKLSEKRAKAVVEALVARGVNAAQLSYEGLGEANPIADNATSEGRAQNRRIEATLTRH